MDLICKKFIEFILADTDFLDMLSIDKSYSDEKIYKIINEIDRVL